MPSTIPITTALKSAIIDLLSDIARRADERGEEVEFHAVSIWIATLLNRSEDIQAAAIAAQHEFSAYAINWRWLETFDQLIQYGGDGVPDFVTMLCRSYLFNAAAAEDALWQQYNLLRQRVMLEAGRSLPESWEPWAEPMRSFVGMLARHLMRENSIYSQLLNTPEARDLADFAPALMTVEDSPLPLLAMPGAVDVDDSATLTAYLDWCLERFSRLDARVPQFRERFGLRLGDVFVARHLLRAEKWSDVDGFVRYQLATGNLPRPNGRSPNQQSGDSPGETVTGVLDRSERMLLLAGSGLGKTTLLRHLVLQHASIISAKRSSIASAIGQDERLPIYLHLADYAESAGGSEQSLLDYIFDVLIEDELQDPSVQGMITRLLEEGRCLILLDGLDTVLGHRSRLMVAMRVNQFANHWCSSQAGNRIVVASRNADDLIPDLLPDFEAYVLPAFDRNEISEFLMRWSLATERARQPMMGDEALHSQAEQATIGILRDISPSGQLRKLAATPLMLRTIVEQHYEGMYLSPQRVALLRDSVELEIREWRLPRGSGRQPRVQEHEAHELLSELAYWLHANRSSGLASEREVTEILTNVWGHRHPEADEAFAREAIADFLAKVRHSTALLTEVRPRKYGFVHMPIQEYFAARYLVARYRTAADRIRRYLHDPRWSEVVRLAIGFVALDSGPDASDLMETAIVVNGSGSADNAGAPSPFEEVLKRDLLFAARILGDGVEVSPALTRSISQQLVDLWLLGDRDSVGRFNMVYDRARKQLAALDGTVAGQYAMHYALRFRDDDREHVRAFFVEALTLWPSQIDTALEAIVSLGRDSSTLVRRAVGEALGRIEALSPDAYVSLLTMVNDSDKQVREVARRALRNSAEAPDSSMRPWVRLLRDNDPTMRTLGANVLGRVGTLPPLVVGELLNLFADDEPDVRGAAAQTLASVNRLPADALEAISHNIDQQRPEVKVAAIQALARPVELSEEIIEQLMVWSKDDDSQIRLATVSVLDACRNRDEQVIHALMDMTDDGTLRVRQAAIEAMGRKGADNTKVAHLLLHLADDTNPGAKISAAKGLGHQTKLSAEGQTYLLKLLNDFHSGVREAAMETVAQLGVPFDNVVDLLVDMTADSDQRDMLHSARTLSRLRGLPPHALTALVRLLPSGGYETAWYIAKCLYQHSPLAAVVVHPLVDLAKGAQPDVRHLAIRILSHSVHAVPGLMEEMFALCADSDVKVRAAAISSLAYARDLPDHALDVLYGMLGHQDIGIKRAAAVSLTALSYKLPHLTWNEGRMQALVSALSQLLEEVPARASWEPDAAQQNAVLDALNRLVAEHGARSN